MNVMKLSWGRRFLLNWLMLLFISGCGGGSSSPGSSSSVSVSPPAAPVLSMTLTATKTFAFSWSRVPGALSYKLMEDPDGLSGYSVIAGASNLSGTNYNHIVPLYKRINARYILQACNSAGCTNSVALNISGNLAAAIGYFKAANPALYEGFGYSVALSGDGNTLAVGTFSGTSVATGMTPSGTVYVFVLNGGIWSQQASIKASNATAGDSFGSLAGVSLSNDGNTLAVGAYGESSAATGINGNQADNSAPSSGAAYVFVRNGGTWSQQAYIKASNTHAEDLFGIVKLSGDGNTLAVGALQESSAATGINGNQTDQSAPDAGAVYVFVRNTNTWSQQAYIKASNTQSNNEFGNAVALSDDGNTLAVGAHSVSGGGAVYVFVRNGSNWSQQTYLQASNIIFSGEDFGFSVALSSDGSTLAVGADNESSAATGINGNQNDHSAFGTGAAYVFSRSSNTWSQQAYIKASNASRLFGYSVSLSSNGNALVVGAPFEPGAAIGINGDQLDNSAPLAGAAYVFSRSNSTWSQLAYVKASNTSANYEFGGSVALTGDGNTLAVGSFDESSIGVGVNGSQDLGTGNPGSGAVYLY